MVYDRDDSDIEPSQSSEQGAPERVAKPRIGESCVNCGEPVGKDTRGIWYHLKTGKDACPTRSDICAAARREAFDKAIAIAKDYYALSAAHWTEQYGDVEISGALEAARDAAPREKTAIEAAGWLPIESAPKDGTSVLVALIRDSRVWRVSDARFNRIGWYTVHGGQSCHWSTHWMPLPEPAQAQKEKINGHQK